MPARCHCWLAGAIAYFPGMALPRVQPIRPTWRKEPFDAPDWLFDVKYDGFRALCYIEQGRCRVVSRNGNAMSRFDALGDQMAAVLDVDDAIIDGEVIAVDETFRPQFYDLLRGTRAPAYVAFDIAWLNGADQRCLPLSDRRRNLQGILPEGASVISEALSVAGKGRELFDLMCAHDLEGIVAKRLDDPYESRVRWLKIKNPDYSQKEGRGDLFNGRRQRPWKREEPYHGKPTPGG
jgi:bifunctional non-homologous end joining protein LigD